jgi:hypothetical protein
MGARDVFPHRLRGRRGILEVGLGALVCALVAGAFVGSGLAQTVLKTPYPLTWLGNNRGQAVQADPENGRMLNRLQIGAPGDQLQVVQDGTRLVVMNLTDGTTTIVDLSLLRVAGVRQGDPGSTKVLLADGRIYLVDKEAGRIDALNALNAETVGQPWLAVGQIADVVADSTDLWALTTNGRLTSLRWSETSQAFAEQERRELASVGPEAVLAAHTRGVTVVRPGGFATRAGTGGGDGTLQVPGLVAPLAAADFSPADMVPVTSRKSGAVHLVGDNGVVKVDGPSLGCHSPDKPAVYRDRVYVPCPPDQKVIVLDRSGRRAEPDLKTPRGRNLELVLNAGLLFVNVADANNALVVKPDGTTTMIRTDDPRVTVNDPNARPTALPSGLGIRPATSRPSAGGQGQDPAKPPASKNPGGPGTLPRPGRNGIAPGGQVPNPTSSGAGASPGGDGSPSLDPSSSTDPTPDTSTSDSPTPDVPPPTSPAPRPEDFTPSGATAEARNDGQVGVSWNPPVNPPASYRILRADTGEVVGTQVGGANSTIVGGLALGQPVSFVIEAVFDDGSSYRSPASNSVVAFGRPGSPNVAVELVARAPDRITLRVTVDVATDGGSPVTSYDLSVTASSGPGLNDAGVSISKRPYQFTLDCNGTGSLCLGGGTVTATATLYNAAGAGPAGKTDATIPAPPQFEYNGSTMFVSSGGKCFDRNLRLATCDGSTDQLWSIRATGEIRPQANFSTCLSSPNGLHFTTNCNAPPDDQRWDVQGSGNIRRFRNQDTGRCLAVEGDPSASGSPVKDLRCQNNNQDTWYLFTPTLPLTAAAQPASFTTSDPERGEQGGLGGAPTVTILLLALTAGLFRHRHRKQHTR